MKILNIKIKRNRAFSLIDVVVGTALMLLVFMSVFGVFRLGIDVVVNSKARIGALSIAENQMEFIRSLSYANVGTISGIPSGNIPQVETKTLNSIVYEERTLIQYIDDPSDGLGADDENGVTADYKRAKVEVSWSIKGVSKNISLVTNIVPPGIENLSGGGTLVINVLDALGAPISGANVHIENNDISPSVSIDISTNLDGQVMFPGSEESSGYEIIVSKDGYSQAKTYDATISNPNPDPGNLTVLAGKTTVKSFQIDKLSTKIVETLAPIKDGSWNDSFIDTSKIFSLSSTTVSSGEVKLEEGKIDGNVYSNNVEPANLIQWKKVILDSSVASSTSLSVKVTYFSNNNFILIPNTDLPGNSIGFASSTIDLSNLDAGKYKGIGLVGFLKTNDASSTPQLFSWEIDYSYGPAPVPNISFNLRGSKTIGSDANGYPIYKYNTDLQTGSNGSITINNLEWDNYNLTIDSSNGYDISESCLPQPRSVDPGTNITTDIYLVPHTANSLLVSVRDTSGALLKGASVRLYRTGFSDSIETGSCGQAFFRGLDSGTLESGTAYSLDVSLSGYNDVTIGDIDVSGASKIGVVLN